MGPSVVPVSIIADGQPQAPSKQSTHASSQSQSSRSQTGRSSITSAPPAVNSDHAASAQASTVIPITVLTDGQPQAPATISQSVVSSTSSSSQTLHVTPITALTDGQPQAPTTGAGTSSSSQAPASTASSVSSTSRSSTSSGMSASGQSLLTGVSERSPAAAAAATTIFVTFDQLAGRAAPSGSQAAGSLPPSPQSSNQLVGCIGNSTLELTLSNGVLRDSFGRTGYIADNYQFQFDGPPQAGALTTAGFSVCGNGSLALGGSTIFWQCLSGSFYNLYDRYWAAQCEAVNINVVKLVGC